MTKIKGLLLLQLLTIFSLTVRANEQAVSLFNLANNLYQQGAYEEAIDAYLGADSLGYQSAALYFNLGNAYYRSNKPAYARLYYERAILLKPGDKDIRANLDFLSHRLTDQFNEVPVIFYKRWYRELVNFLTSNQWFLLSLLLFIMAASGMILFRISRKRILKKASFYAGILLFVFSMVFLGMSGSRYQYVKSAGAIVMSPAESVRSGPDHNSTVLFVLHEGTRVQTGESLGEWVEVTISDGRKGWLPSRTIEQI